MRTSSAGWSALNRWLKRHAAMLGALASVVTILGGTATYLQIREQLRRPDIVLMFEDPKDLRFRVSNLSQVVARLVQYQFALWRLDISLRADGSDPGNLGTFPNKIEWIRSGDATEPVAFESMVSQRFWDQIPNGQTIFGWATIQCAECIRRRDYWLLWKKGELSWYAEVPEGQEASMLNDLLRVRQAGIHYEKILDQVIPQSQRTTVQ